MENFIWNQYWQQLAILNTENIKICRWITKLEAINMQCVCIFTHLLDICRKFEFLISQNSIATYVRWDGYCHVGFVVNFARFPTVQKFWKSVKISQSYREFKGGNFFETQCIIKNYYHYIVRDESQLGWLHLQLPRLMPMLRHQW